MKIATLEKIHEPLKKEAEMPRQTCWYRAQRFHRSRRPLRQPLFASAGGLTAIADMVEEVISK